MHLDQAIVINSRESENGQYTVSGWINCPADSRSILRFVTNGTAENQVDGLHWAVTGGWYKYLPATGSIEYFSVTAEFDREVHGIPEIRIERWRGSGEIDLLLHGSGWQPVSLFWGDEAAFSLFQRNTIGLIVQFPFKSGFVTASEATSPSLLPRLKSPRPPLGRTSGLKADLDKQALKELERYNFDALVIDLNSLCLPLVKCDGSYVEETREARALGVIPVEADPLTPTSDEYLSVLKRSLLALIRVIRPRPIFFLTPKVQEEDSVHSTEYIDPGHFSVIERLNLEDLGMIRLAVDSTGDGQGHIANPVALSDLVEPYSFTFDEHMTEKEPLSRLVLHNRFSSASATPHFQGLELPSDFEIQVDVLVPQRYPHRNLILSLDLEDREGNLIDEPLGKHGISRSKMDGLNYFRYFPEIQGSETASFTFSLPEHVRCTGFSVVPLRELGSVFVSRVAIQSDVIVRRESLNEVNMQEEA